MRHRPLSRHILNLDYPINVARNVALELATTYFVLACDVELYPSPGLATSFLEAVRRGRIEAEPEAKMVYVVPAFEVTKRSDIPEDKSECMR